ncbi:MAG: hypothetical protein KJ737_06960 [Proteobacteria bacterium]|nr:hypothetical protein [Pseudomonadota bacterium]
MGLFSFLFSGKKSIWDEIDNGINQIKHGIYMRLSTVYLEKYGKDVSGLLAASVTNELFSLPPTNDENRSYLKSNKRLVEDEVMVLRNNEDILTAATHAMRIKMTIIFRNQKSGTYDKNLSKPYLKMVERGLAQKAIKDLGSKEFLVMAEKFYKLSIQPRKSGK